MSTTPMTDTESRGWQVGKNLKQCLGELLDKQYLCDVTFNITQPDGTSKKLHAHKLILGARSPVFEAMFNGNFVEGTTDVDIVDSEVEPFAELLRYIYSEDINLTGNNVLQILNLGRKYIVESLVDECTQFLSNCMTSENVSEIITHSVTNGEDAVTENCLRLIWPNTKDFFQAPSFMQMSRDALHCFLTSSAFLYGFTPAVCSEAEILRAVLKWADHQSRQNSMDMREALGDCIYGIRYISLTMKEFVSQLGQINVLTAIEKSMWLCFLIDENEHYNQELQDLHFNTMTRGLIVKRGSRHSYSVNYSVASAKKEVFNMTTDKKTNLCRIGVYGGNASNIKCSVTVDILNASTQEKETFTTTFMPSGGDTIYPVSVTKPIVMQPNTTYEVTATISNTIYLCSVNKTEFQLQNDVNVKILRQTYISNTTNAGVISELGFCS